MYAFTFTATLINFSSHNVFDDPKNLSQNLRAETTTHKLCSRATTSTSSTTSSTTISF